MSIQAMDPGVPWSLVKSGFKKTPQFSTLVQTPAARRGITAVSLMPFPIWRFEVDLSYVRGGEGVQRSVLQKFLGCFMDCRGRGRRFYFSDPNDNGVSDNGIFLNYTAGAAEPMGQTGDGVSKNFLIARNIDVGIDVVQPADYDTMVIYENGVPVPFTVPGSGVITFQTAPAPGALLSWQGRFHYLCRFAEDTVEDLARVSATMNRDGLKEFLWSASSIVFESEFV